MCALGHVLCDRGGMAPLCPVQRGSGICLLREASVRAMTHQLDINCDSVNSQISSWHSMIDIKLKCYITPAIRCVDDFSWY